MIFMGRNIHTPQRYLGNLDGPHEMGHSRGFWLGFVLVVAVAAAHPNFYRVTSCLILAIF